MPCVCVCVVVFMCLHGCDCVCDCDCVCVCVSVSPCSWSWLRRIDGTWVVRFGVWAWALFPTAHSAAISWCGTHSLAVCVCVCVACVVPPCVRPRPLCVCCTAQAIGDSRAAHVWSTRPDKLLQPLSTQALREGDQCSAVALLELPVKGVDSFGLYLNLGTENGLLYRSEVDRANGQLTETHTRWVSCPSLPCHLA